MSGMIIDNQNLAERILDAFPSGTYALAGLLRLLDIVETDRVPTAAVQCVAQPRLLINPDFVAHQAQTPEKLMMLVMHELHHVLLGHTTLFPRLTPAQNFVFDAVINGLICRMFPEPAYTAMLTDFYSHDRFPDCLLRPPQGWHMGQSFDEFSTAPALAALDSPLRERAREIHAALYSEGGASYHEVHRLLPSLLKRAQNGKGFTVPLLGGHGDNNDHQGLEHTAPVLFELVRETVEHWPQPPDPIRGRSLADIVRQSMIAPRRTASNRTVLRNLIRKVAGRHGRDGQRQPGWDEVTAQVAIPRLTRRSSVLHGLGVPVLLHETTVPWRRTCPGAERVHIYLDVSGSMAGVLRPLFGATLDCAPLLWPQIHLFSTRVIDITPAQLRAGLCRTTEGTSIDVVAEHIADNHIKRALIVTDGWVGRPAGQHRSTLENTRLAVAYLGPTINQQDLADVARHTAVLNPEAQS